MKYTVTEHKGNGYIARIHRPILTEEERKKREDEVRRALVRFYIETRGNK